MFVSRQLKEDNIAEYLLYMWQIEDLIRANNLDIERINSTLVEPVNLTNEQKKELLGWYEELIEMIRREDVIKSGHLQINKNVISTLTDLHLTLLRSTKFPYYNAVYYKTLPYIVELRSKGNNHELSELENCFEVLYGILILRLQKKEISQATLDAAKIITHFLAQLSTLYKKDRIGELDLE